MKEIFVIPTTHHQNANYNSNDIAKLIITINPDVIFSELPKNWDEIKTNNVSQDNQEDCAIKIFQEHKNVKVFNVDLPYRNEIAKSLGKIIIPLSCTGYVAKEILEDIKKNINDFSYLKDYILDLESTVNPKDLVNLTVKIVDSVRY